MSVFLHTKVAILAYVVGLAVILYAIWGAVKKRPHDKTMKRLAIGYRSAMDLTLFLGLVVIMTHHGGFATDLGMHVVAMLLATVVAHVVPSVMRKRPQEERTLVPYAVATAISLGITTMGILVILP
jgi:uncharacterized membrane protein YobD (UPF0266 family)